MTNKEMIEAMGVCVIPVGFYDFACDVSEVDEEMFDEGSGDWVTDYEKEGK
jgi:hypothetical protein